jgi:plasmid maintenance system killer protein
MLSEIHSRKKQIIQAKATKKDLIDLNSNHLYELLSKIKEDIKDINSIYSMPVNQNSAIQQSDKAIQENESNLKCEISEYNNINNKNEDAKGRNEVSAETKAVTPTEIRCTPLMTLTKEIEISAPQNKILITKAPAT